VRPQVRLERRSTASNHHWRVFVSEPTSALSGRPRCRSVRVFFLTILTRHRCKRLFFGHELIDEYGIAAPTEFLALQPHDIDLSARSELLRPCCPRDLDRIETACHYGRKLILTRNSARRPATTDEKRRTRKTGHHSTISKRGQFLFRHRAGSPSFVPKPDRARLRKNFPDDGHVASEPSRGSNSYLREDTSAKNLCRVRTTSGMTTTSSFADKTARSVPTREYLARPGGSVRLPPHLLVHHHHRRFSPRISRRAGAGLKRLGSIAVGGCDSFQSLSAQISESRQVFGSLRSRGDVIQLRAEQYFVPTHGPQMSVAPSQHTGGRGETSPAWTER
jgi:hypothetical protein